MSPLSVAPAPHYVKEVELGNSHFLGQQHGGVKHLPLDAVGHKKKIKRKRALWLLFSFVF